MAIVGPTATGKTDVGVQVALRINGEIVSADSMLVYKGMDIGTAKPSNKECLGITHHMIDIVAPQEEYSVARYQNEAELLISDIHRRNKLPILVGGTGLYIRAITDEYEFSSPGEDKVFRLNMEQKVSEKGVPWLYQKLESVDPDAAKTIHPNNIRRVIRALEVYELTGKRFSTLQKASYNSRLEYHVKIYGLMFPREILYNRINKRVDIMIKSGLIDEVKKLLQQGVKRQSTAMQGIGYKEIASYIYGEISLEQAVELIKRDTRRYAKRQLTWFRRDPRIQWIDMNSYDNPEEVAEEIIKKQKENISTM